MTTRDLTDDDINGFLQMHAQRAEETRFSQLEGEWTPASTLEDVAILVGVFCCWLAVPAGWVLWRIFA